MRNSVLQVREKIKNNDHPLKRPFQTTYAREVLNTALGELELLVQ